MPTNPNALTLEDMQLERSQQAFFGQYGGFVPADTAGMPVRAAVSLAHGMNTESVAKEAAAARELSLPVETVRSMPQETREELNTRRVMQDQGMASFASRSPEHAALIVDDPDAWEKVWRQVRAMPEAIGQAWDIGKHNQQYAALGKEFMDAPEDKLEDVRKRMDAHKKERQAFIPVDSYADEIALTTAVEQLPRMAEMLPKQAAGAALAGMGGAVAGSIVPGLGTTTAAVASARAGWLAATAYTAFEEERNAAVADFALLQDEEGNTMSRDDVVGAATIYAAGAAAIETAGEAFFLSLAKPFLGNLAGKIAPKAFMKTAVQRAMENKSTRAAMLNIAKRIGQNALAEGGEESLQGLLQDVMQVVAMAKSDEGGNTSFGPQTVFKTETAKNLVQNFGAGFGAGLWLGGVPMITLGAQDVVAAHRANRWADEQKKLHAEVEATKVKKASPELTQAMLEEGPNLEGSAVIPADALMELHQKDEIILQALGMEEKAVQQAAEMGQELTVPLARLHASLDQQQAEAVLDIAREEPQAMSVAESRKLTDRLRAMGDRAIAETAGRTEELRARDMEVERLREEMTRAVDSVPGLRARLESGEGLQGEAEGVTQFVEDNLRVAVGMARYLADETGRPIAEFLRPISYEGLDVNSQGQLVPVYKIKEAEQNEEELARAEADRPFWELLWGRLDPESVKADYAETYKELRKSKRGLFMPAGRGGVPLDQIADELNERGIFTGSADDLLELLKTKERPRRGYYQEDLLGEDLSEKNSLGVPVSRVTVVEGEVTAQELDEALAALAGQDLLNVIEGITAQVNANQKRKLESATAANKSLDNGFTRGEHRGLAAQIANAWQWAAEARRSGDTKNGMPDVAIRRFVSALQVNGQDVFAWLTVKETPKGLRIYSAELMDEIKLRDIVGSGTAEAATDTIHRSFEEIIERLNRPVNEESGSLYQRAFHGSPHRFMQFMLDHIGSGEGAQAHGWGLYFAQNRETAEGYRKQLTGGHHEYLQVGDRKYWLREGSKEAAWIDEDTGMPAEFYEQDHLTRMYHKAKGATTDQEYLAAVEEWLQDDQYDAEQKEILRRQRDEYLNAQATIELPGQVYEVDVPENNVLLDEQKKLAEQPKPVQAALAKLGFIADQNEALRQYKELDKQVDALDEQIENAANLEERARLVAERKALTTGRYQNLFVSAYRPYLVETGRDIYKLLVDNYEDISGNPEREASLALNEAGIKGITYDGRQDGRCFVIFDDQAIDMLDTFYQFIGEEGAARLDEADEASTRMDNLAVAREMEQAKKGAAAIKLATGWERGADGKWRYELDDSLIDIAGYKARRREELEKDPNVKAVSDALWMKSILESGGTIADAREAYRKKFGMEAEPGAGRMAQMTDGAELVKMERELMASPMYKLKHFITESVGKELFAAYPDLAEMPVELSQAESTYRGAYLHGKKSIVLYDKNLDGYDGMKATLLHEVQHAIQNREGFASGGNDKTARMLAAKPLQELLEVVGFEAETYARNAEELAAIEFGLDRIRFTEKPSLFEKTGEFLRVKPFAMPRDKKERAAAMEAMVGEWIQERSAEFRSLGHGWWAEYAEKQDLVERRKKLQAKNRKLAQSSKDAARATQLLDKLDEMSDYDIYHALAGEVEARNTARRMTMTYEERLASLAKDTEDVARKDQIFLQDALGRAMAMGEGTRKGVTRGETVFTPNAMGMDYVVRLFKHANLSTLAHESSHVFFLQMKQLVDQGEASPRIQADYATLCRWVGSKDGYLNRDQHEKLAKGMELFLREGKAPSKKLEGAFGRFRRWLTEVYKAITGPYFQDEQGRQITLNPEVRDVFSRILATQEEVARQAADEVIGRDFTAELDKLGVTGAQRVAITGLVKEAKDMAETRLHEAREAGRKAMQAKWKKEAEAQVAEERIYKARKAMRNSGMNMLALASAVGNEAAGEFFRKLPGIKREGANPWAFAASFGYDSVDQMVQEMLTTPSKAERVEQLVAQKQAEHDKQFKAQSLIASDQAAAMEEMVQEHIIKAMGGKERGVALAQIKQDTREYLAGLPMDDAINSGKFRYQAVRLMHLEREAIMAQDYGRAMDINFKLRLNMELTRQSQELRDKTHGVARRAAKFCASKIHTPVCRYAVAFLGMKVGLMPGTKMIARTAQDKDLDMVKAWANEATEYGYTFEMDEELWYGDINPWRHMSLSYFDRVYRQLVQIMTIEQNMRKMDTWQGQQELAAVSVGLSNHILGHDPTRQKVGVESDKPMVRKLKKFFNMQLTVGTRLKLWDDDKPLGKAWQLIMRPMQDARADELRRFEKAAKQIRAIIGEAYSHEELMAMKDKKFDEALGESVSYEERLLVLLNLGNMGNKNRLMEGFRNVKTRQHWTQREIDLMIAPLQKKDYDFAQKVWDHFEQYKKERFDQEESLTGVRPLEVEPSPLNTAFGSYRGGYFPIKYDTDRGARAASYDKTNKSENNMLPSVAHGAMKDRQDKGLESPLKLRFSVITDAVAESVHDLAFRRPVIEVSKLLRQRDVQNAMEETQGAIVYKEMWDWLNSLAGTRPAENSLDNAASWARSHMAIFAMGFKVTTMLAQASGLLATTTQLGWKWTMRGVLDTFRHGGTWSARAVWEDTQARSVMMKNRMQSFDRDVLALTSDLTEAGSSNKFLDPIFKADDWVKKHAFTLTGWVQLWAADLPTWRGAFLKGIEELGMDEKEAAVYADTMVETAQGSGAAKDLSALMRQDGMTQLLTVFFSYFNALYNMFYRSAAMARRHKDMPHMAHLASMALVLWFVEPAITNLLTNRWPDDDEGWLEWALKNGLQQPFQMIVGVRDISNMIWNYIEGKFGQGYRFSPAADVIEAFGKTVIDLDRVIENVGEGDYEGTKKAAKSLSRDIGMISGTPLLGAQMQTTLGNMWDWLDGSEEFNLQDLFFTRKK